MGWPKGRPRPPNAGRKKGTPNKQTLRLEEKLAAFEDGKGFDPVLEAMNLYTLIHADNPLVAVKILMGFMEYLYPKRKAVEIEIRETKRFQFIVEDENGKQRTYRIGSPEVSPETG